MATRYPIVPNNIIVHLGKPDENARDITVPFTDYISNVASSEIYPTWPKNALIANIYTMISFAMNRIYNEWYRSKGYNYDITSSSLYDQTYIENRSTYENINIIVQDIFNNYVVKGNQIQPYFTTYCDGRVTTCDGLSQWGSVSLANQNKNYLDILIGPVLSSSCSFWWDLAFSCSHLRRSCSICCAIASSNKIVGMRSSSVYCTTSSALG